MISQCTILSEAESFNNEGMSAPSAKWKGKGPGHLQQALSWLHSHCFTFNSVTNGTYEIAANFPSPIDSKGHGTHTYSTVAGREVQGASYFGPN